MRLWFIAVVFTLVTLPGPAIAQGKAKAARELAEWLIGRGSKEAVEAGADGLSRRIEAAVAKWSEGVLVAVEKTNMPGLAAIERAGEYAPAATKLLATHGAAAIPVAERKAALKIVTRYGDDAATALVRHPGGYAEELIEAVGEPAVKALSKISPQNHRRLAFMEAASQGAVTRRPGVLEQVGRHGDRLVEFLWFHRKALASVRTLATVLRDVDGYLDGSSAIPETTDEPTGAALPVVLAGESTAGMAPVPSSEPASVSNGNWLVWAGVVTAVRLGVFVGVVWIRRRNRVPTTSL